MRSSVAANFAGITATAALLSALLVASVLAQEAVEPQDTAAQPETNTVDEPAGDEADATAVAESGAVLDYEPTESISEDLSVSFPVDI